MTLRDRLAAVQPTGGSPGAIDAAKRERHRLKAEAFGKLPSFAGRSWSFGSYKVVVVSGPREDAANRAVAFTLRLERNGVDVTPEQWKPDYAWRNPPVESDDLQAALLAVMTTDLRDAVARLAYAPSPPPPPTGGFLSWPASKPMSRANTSDVVIEKLSFTDPTAIALTFANVHNLTIRKCDFAGVAKAIYALSCTGTIVIEDCRFADISGTPAIVGNFVQLDKCSGGGFIRRNRGKGGKTEDIVSLYGSVGSQQAPYYVEDNQFEGAGWTSVSGSGIMLGDAGGSWQIARRNTLLNPGQVGIGIAGGTHNAILDNTIKGAGPLSNIGIYVANYAGGECSDNEVSGNQVDWRAADGSENPIVRAGTCAVLIVTRPNQFYGTVLDAEKMRVVL